MSDFEVCPIGTLRRLAAAKLRADRAEQCAATEAARADKTEAECRRIYDVISLANRRSDYLGIRLREVVAERDVLLEALRDMVSDHANLSAATLDFARAAIAKVEGGSND